MHYGERIGSGGGEDWGRIGRLPWEWLGGLGEWYGEDRRLEVEGGGTEGLGGEFDGEV